MNIPSYDIECNEERLVFEFLSISDTKTVRKTIQYTNISDNYYNLFLGDINDEGLVSDKTRSNNKDLERVLSTVVKTLFIFFNRYSNSSVYFNGGTPSRTRLYQIAILKYMNEFSEDFVILGVNNDILELFNEGRFYEGFIITPK